MCQKMIYVPETVKISKILLSREDLCFTNEALSASNFEFEVSLFEENLSYFYIDKLKMNNITCFLNKKISLFFNEEKKKITGELQKPLKKEGQLFVLKKKEEIFQSFYQSQNMKGQVLIFIPGEYYICNNSHSFY